MKNRKKLFAVIPVCTLVLCAALLGGYYAIEGESGLLGLFAKIDRTDMMAVGHLEGLPYRIYAPEGEALPLVLYLHGSGERGDDNRAQTKKNSIMQTLLNEENLQKYPCIILAPQCPADRGWDTEQLMALLETFRANSPMDPARIYITGLSMGGYAAWEMLAAYPDCFAAAAYSRTRGATASLWISSESPTTAFMGVRISWDIFAKNSLFARDACSASSVRR